MRAKHLQFSNRPLVDAKGNIWKVVSGQYQIVKKGAQ